MSLVRTISFLAALLPAALPAQTSLAGVLKKHSRLDLDGDGVAELGALDLLSSRTKGTPVLVLLEARLADSLPLRKCLDRYLADLASAGFAASLVRVELPSGGAHRDGRILLALRRLLKECHEASKGCAGAVLVGHFPDAYLVRTVNWRKHTRLKLGAKRWDRVKYLRRVPEDVARRCDLVLADLDGNWEELYVQAKTQLPTVVAVWPDGVPQKGGACNDVHEGKVSFADFFHVVDGEVAVKDDKVLINDDARDRECTAQDRKRGNPLARPEILVSRIDARGAAWSPRRELNGRSLFDASGRPVAVPMPKGKKLHWQKHVWRPDPELEVRLLVEYFDRNHRYRTTARGRAFKPASIAWGMRSGFERMKRGAKEWSQFAEAGYDMRKEVGLCAVIEWFRRPAVLRTMRAHSDPRGSVFKKTDPKSLHDALGGPPLCWSPSGGRLVPSLAAPTRGGHANFFLWRTLWENGALPSHPYLMVHTGCHAMSPTASGLPYEHPKYGAFQNADSLLFLTPALAIVGRAKVFYDEPRGFVEALAEGKSFGAAWARYFELESRAKSWAKVGGDIGRKRSYFWSLVGDWTLRLKN
ncbi:MAG: hypothetical protein ACYTF5_01185 [Planctomycetota bacterium]